VTFLLDTCTFVWLCADPQRLSETAKAVIDATETTLFVSDASALELTLKWKAGKIHLPDPPRLWIEQQLATWGLDCRPLTREDIYRAGELPEYHRDPFDRLLVAIAINRGATILTPDTAIRRYPVGTRW
jgi:PIN domain nuclease of toxin-antitoxin system